MTNTCHSGYLSRHYTRPALCRAKGDLIHSTLKLLMYSIRLSEAIMPDPERRDPYAASMERQSAVTLIISEFQDYFGSADRALLDGQAGSDKDLRSQLSYLFA